MFFKKKETPKKEEWLGKYDESQSWVRFGNLRVGELETFRGDIKSPNCNLAYKKVYNELSGDYSFELFYPSNHEPYIFYGHNYMTKDFLESPLLKDAVILKRNHYIMRTFGSSPYSDADFYIVSTKEADLCKDLEDNPIEYHVDDKVLMEKEFKQYTSDKIIFNDRVALNSLLLEGLKVDNIVKVNRITNERDTEYGILTKDLETKCSFTQNTYVHKVLKPVFGDWFFKSERDELLEELKKSHEPQVIKGTNKPPYFIVRGVILESNTYQWFEFVKNTFFDGEVKDWMLEKCTQGTLQN